MRKKAVVLLITIFLISLNITVNSSGVNSNTNTDFDPLVDVSVTVEIKTIRFLEVNGLDANNKKMKSLNNGPNFLINILRGIIDKKTYVNAEPSLYLKVFINDVEFTSNIWDNTKYIYDPQWSAILNVPDDQEIVNVKIQLWQSRNNEDDILCDISPDFDNSDDSKDAELEYSIKTGRWTGDDKISDDPSGYGRLSGCDDGTIYETDLDCELWFNIYQNDYDEDGITYWSEVNNYNTNPEEKNFGDPDDDKIPVEWEWKWGYNPFVSENHKELDPDGDSINNYEEYLTSAWFSDPFRKDVFVELDIMDEGPNGEKTYFPVNAKELLQTSFDRQNIVLHLDMGEMGGHDIIPFYDVVDYRDLRDIYEDYFLHGDNNNWRRGVFHYGVVDYSVGGPPHGYMFRSNAFQIASSGMEEKAENPSLGSRDVVYGSGFMHELGHTFGFWPIPGHNRNSMYPWQLGYWINRPYQSCMNYGWTFRFVDYSDGSRSSPDIDDWERIQYDYFERE